MARSIGTRLAQAGALALVAVAVALALLPGRSAAQASIVCAELGDPDLTRALIEGDAEISRFEIVTPDFLWDAPGQAESRRFPPAKSDVSPNLAGRDDVYLRRLDDAGGQLRVLDFGVREPDALALEGLRGSLVLHEAFQNRRAIGSLFYTGSDNRLAVTALECQRFDAP
ncbi:MAG: hypothetical protein GX576_15100 [Thauera phenolivorans]|uniref:Uncharacterized protein n=1 Tax=Thauera phenolivorans TaxID=1792543 RepID=A0A7X7R9J0_9RHOO|nr:hypothetical protein [Thauera phenolivorans]NLF55694.1 hypothetical protein [Thauera phenolivorans]